MDLLLGLDIGTTATKSLLIDIEGNIIASSSYNYNLITPKEDFVEQDPEDFWQGVITTTRKVLSQTNPNDKVLAISFSTQGGTLIPIDGNFKPVYNAISWMDHRAYRQAKEMREILGDEKVYKKTGWAIYDGLPWLNILWIKSNIPDIFASTKYFMFVNDFIIHRLTGQMCMDPSNAGITQLFDIEKCQWDKEMLDLSGITQDQLSPVQRSGFVVGKLMQKASDELGLSEETLIVNGAHDQYCAALGSGVINPGDVMLSCGTAWVILGVMDELRFDDQMRLSISPHIIPNRWGALKSMGAVGSCMEWFIDNILSQGVRKNHIYDKLNASANKSPICAKGLIFFPSSGGYGHGARGGFLGLSISHSIGDMARAIMEGITFDLRWTLEDVNDAGIKTNILRMVGGAASSPVWTKIVADVTNIPVVIPSVIQSASYGSALLAGIGCGVFDSPTSACQILSKNERLIEPNKDNIGIYNHQFGIYKHSFNLIKDSLMELANI
ncbi:MAG: xylulokinase [Candidatus Poribacteria bacterium]